MEHTGKGIEDILKQHWSIYGRNYFTRYDYEECAGDPCNEMVATLEKTITDPSFVGRELSHGGKTYKVKVADNFSYIDPVDKSVSTKQVTHTNHLHVKLNHLLIRNFWVFLDRIDRACALCLRMVAALSFV